MQMLLLLLVVVAVAGALLLGFGEFVQPEPTVVEKPVTLQPVQ